MEKTDVEISSDIENLNSSSFLLGQTQIIKIKNDVKTNEEDNEIKFSVYF